MSRVEGRYALANRKFEIYDERNVNSINVHCHKLFILKGPTAEMV